MDLDPDPTFYVAIEIICYQIGSPGLQVFKNLIKF
jgi:hypothetical protein